MNFLKALVLFALISTTAFAATYRLRPLPENDSFRRTVSAIATQVSDGNISTGKSEIYAGEINIVPRAQNKDEWLEMGEELFQESFKDLVGGRTPREPKLKTRVANFSEAELEKAVLAIAEANAYDTSNKENFSADRGRLWVLLRKLTDTKKDEPIRNVKVLVTGARFPNKFSDDSEDNAKKDLRTVQNTVFLNTDTGVALVIFTIEGTM
jgi:hypothetical protein